MSLRSVFVPRVPLGLVKNPASPLGSAVVYHAPHQRHHASPVAKGVAGKSLFIQPPALISSPPSMQKRYYAARPVGIESSATSAFSPPDQSKYIKNVEKYDEEGNKNFSYFLIGSLVGLTAVGAKNIVTNYLITLSASADVLAMAKVEIDLANIAEGSNVVVKWRGKPIMVRHRTDEEIAEANSVSLSDLPHPETDAERTKDPKFLVMIGVCTHLGCVPIGEAGDFGGWFCPCHGSHYDISGRIRKGPAPLNLEIPPYEFSDDKSKVIIG